MVLGVLSPTLMYAQVSVGTDIDGHWAEAQIERWIERGIVKGYEDGTFKPENSIKRSEFAALMNRTFGFVEKAEVNFSDIEGTEWFVEDIAKAVAAGYMKGDAEGTFRPDDPIARQEAALVLARIYELEDQGKKHLFKDLDEIASWSHWAVMAVVDAGLMEGYPDGTFGPKNPIKRSETVTVLDRLVAEIFTEKGVYGKEDSTTTIAGNAHVLADGVEIQNAKITGDLLIAQSVGYGTVILDNVTVDGNVKVQGGGKDSIILKDSKIGSLEVVKKDVRIVITGGAEIAEVYVRVPSTIVQEEVEGEGVAVLIIEELTGEGVVTISGNFEEIRIIGEGARVAILDGQVENLYIEAPEAVVELGSDATIANLVVDEPAEVAGTGSITNATIKASGTVIEPEPENITIPEGVTAIIAGEEVVGGEELPSEPVAPPVGPVFVPVSAISVSPTTMTLTVGATGTITATVEPANATNKKVNWTSSDANIATVDADGIVTAKAKGIADITAISAADSNKKATCKVIVADNWSDVADTTWYNDTDSSFTISTAEQLAGLAKLVNEGNNFANKTITLGTDIDLLGLEWVPIGYAERDGYKPEGPSFQGVFDGKGKTISNLKITPKDNIGDGSEEYAYGLIGCMTKGSVRDLTINNPQIDGTGYSNGAVIGFLSYGYSNDAHSVITIENCTVVGGKIKGHEAAGGIIGRLIGSRDSADNEATLRIQVVNCQNQGTAIEVTSNNAAGGIVGNQYRTHNTEQVLIKDCVNSGNVTSPHMAGGIAGQIANGTLDGGINTGTIIGGYTDKGEYGHYNGGQLIGYSTGAKIKNVTDLFDLKNIFETGGGMPIYIELTGDITATGYKGERSGEAEIDSNSITMKNCRFLDFSGNTTLTVAEGKTINLYTGYNNTVRGEREATLTIAGEGNVNVGKEGSLKHFYKDKAGTVVAADESGNVIKGKYTLVVKSGDNTNRNQEIWVDATPPTLQSLTAYVGEEERVAEDNTLTWTVGETVTEIIAVVSEPVKIVDGAEAVVTMSGGTIPEGTVYGTIAVDETDNTKLIITPNSGNETAGLAGTFTFTVATGVVEDLAGNRNAAVSITLIVSPDQAAINERLAITSVSIADNKAYASTAADGGTVRVLGYGVCINLDAKGDGKTVNDTTSIVVELYKGETLLGQQTFNEAGYTKHANASSISGTIDAGGQYVATSWNNSWSAKISDIPDKAVAKVQYKDGIATVEKQLTFTDAETKIFFAAEAVYALFTNPLAGVDELVLADGVTQEQINAAQTLVSEVTLKPEQNKVVLQEMVAKANALLNPDQGGGTDGGTSDETGGENS